MKLVLLVFWILMSLSAMAQNITSGGAGDGVFYLKPMDSSAPSGLMRGSFVGPHLLGDTITYLFNEFEKEYVFYKKTSGAYPVEEMVIQKRQIYKSVHQLDDYFKKILLDGSITKPEAVSRFRKILEIGLKLSRFETAQFEKDLKKIRDPEEKEEFFQKLINL